MRRILDGFYRVCFAAGAFGLAMIAVMVTAQIVGRLFGVLVPAAQEVAGYLMAASSFLALAYTLRVGGHVRVSLLINNLQGRRRLIAEILCLAIGLGLSVFLLFYMGDLLLHGLSYGAVSGGMIGIPLWIPQSFVVFGLFALSIAVLDSLVSSLRGRLPDYVDNEH